MAAECSIEAGLRYGRTVIERAMCSAPYHLTRPFEKNGRQALMLMSATPGMLDGDRAEINISLKPGAELELCTQSYGKLFRSQGRGCSQSLRAHVASGASLLYLPKPVIAFAGSDFTGDSLIELDEGASLIYSDILACGRTGHGERFAMRRYSSRIEVRRCGRPVFLERCLIVPPELGCGSPGFFGEHSHSGLLYINSPNSRGLLGAIRSVACGCRLGASEAAEGLLVRAAADSGEAIEAVFMHICGLAGLWTLSKD